jgi:glycine betaine/proline transport system ATP-binding protein
VQVGTPEDVVAHPIDDYVADFTRDVPRAHVLTARSIMRSTDGAAEFAGDVDAAVVIQDVLPLVVKSDLPLRVMESGRQVGVLDRTAVLEAMMEA